MFPEHQQSIIGVRKRGRKAMYTDKTQIALADKNRKSSNISKTLINASAPLKTDSGLPKMPRGRKPRKMKHSILVDSEQSEHEKKSVMDYSKLDKNKLNEKKNNSDRHLVTANDCGREGMAVAHQHVGRGRRRKSNQDQRLPEVMTARRKRVWQIMSKKELGRYHRIKLNNHKEVTQNCKRVATMCMKVVRQRAMQSQKIMKETIWRAKRLTREMLAYWKRYERIERDTRRRMEKEAEEQRKMDFELLEAKRQQRKLNFLITQTELYAHFMSRKLGQGSEADQLRILNQLDEEINPRLASYDDYDAESLKDLAKKNASEAFKFERSKTDLFDTDTSKELNSLHPVLTEQNSLQSILPQNKDDLPQPSIFQGKLKTYQIKGKANYHN